MTGNKINITDYTTDYINGYRMGWKGDRLGDTILIANRYGVLFAALVVTILLAGSIGTTVNVKAAAVSNSNNNGSSSSKSNMLCLDGDARDETYYVGYVDGINDFHHIKRYGITAFFDSQAEADYHKGYQAGWADAQVNGTTTIDKDCFDTRVN
jgi:hypothetical protein